MDHEGINADVAGGASPSSAPVDNWSNEFGMGVPEPGSFGLLVMAVGSAVLSRRRKAKAA